jgi:hypothetical protein
MLETCSVNIFVAPAATRSRSCAARPAGDARFEADKKKMGIAAVCKMAQENIRNALRVRNKKGS